MALQTSERGYNVIRSFEGNSLKAYKDQAGVWTIGYGQTNADAAVLGFQVKEGVTITKEQSEALLKAAVPRLYEPAVNKAMGAPNQAQFDAGVSFHYNTGAITKATWVKDFVAKNMPSVHSNLLTWNKAGGKVLAGLTRRREREWTMIDKSDYGTEGGPATTAPATSNQPGAVPSPQAPASSSLADRIVAAMRQRGYEVFEGPDVVNICYVEGMNLDETSNANRHNAWDDLRVVFRYDQGKATILGKWEATTEPGAYWTDHPMNSDGAFHIALGQQTAWVMGEYHGHPALRQSGNLSGTRDKVKDYKRDGGHVNGQFGVHHHAGYNYKKDDIGRSSAGCQVGRTTAGHDDFIRIVSADRRYKADKKFVWTSTVMPAAWVTGASSSADVPLDGTPGTLGPGTRSPEVKDFQGQLIAVGYDLGPKKDDGVWGDKTSAAVVDYQKNHPQLLQTGTADPGTRAALGRDVAAKSAVNGTLTKGAAAGGASGVIDVANGGHWPVWVYVAIGVVVAGSLLYTAWKYRDEIVVMLKGKKPVADSFPADASPQQPAPQPAPAPQGEHHDA